MAEKQKTHISFLEGRYTPILPNRKIGITFLRDSTPGLPERYLGEKEEQPKMEVEKPAPLPNIPEEKKKEEDELAPPEEFDYDEEKQPLKKSE